MPKEFYIINAGRVVYSPGHYTFEDAESIARNASEREPGKTFTVVEAKASYYQPAKRKAWGNGR